MSKVISRSFKPGQLFLDTVVESTFTEGKISSLTRPTLINGCTKDVGCLQKPGQAWWRFLQFNCRTTVWPCVKKRKTGFQIHCTWLQIQPQG